MQTNQILFNSNLLSYIIIILLISGTFIIGFQYNQTYNSSLFKYDDAIYLNVIDNLRKGYFLKTNIIFPESGYSGDSGLLYERYDLKKIMDKNPSLFSDYHKAPLFFLITSGFFHIFNANPTNWIFYGSLFNIIISSIFISFYFLLIKRHFNYVIATVSSVIIVTFPIFLTHLTLTDMYPLSFLLMVISFYFIAEKQSNYLLFGLFSGLAVLSNQIGILAIVSYSNYLLFKKEFKGLLIVLAIWFLVVSPWMIYNFFTVGDFGTSLGIPYTDRLSALFQNLTIHSTKENPSTFGWQLKIPESQKLPFDTFYNAFVPKGLDTLSLTTTIILFSFFTFFSVKILKKHLTKKGIFFLILPPTVIYLISYFSEPILFFYVLESIILFALPISLGLFLWIKKSDLLERNISRFSIFSLFLAMHTLFAVFYLSLTAVGIVLKHLFPLYFLLTPVGLLGLIRITSYFPSKKIKQKKFLFIITLTLISIFFINLIAEEIPYRQNVVNNIKCPEKICEFIRNNIDKNSVIAADKPGPFFVATGNPIVALDTINSDNLSNYIKKYSIKYFVMHKNSLSIQVIEPSSLVFLEANNIKSYVPIFLDSDYYVISSKDLGCSGEFSTNSLVTKIISAVCFEEIGHFDEAIENYNISIEYLDDLQPYSPLQILSILGWHYNHEYTLGYVSNQSGDVSSYRISLINNMLSLLKDDLELKLVQAHDFISNKRYEEALDIYEEVLVLDPFNSVVHEEILDIFYNDPNLQSTKFEKFLKIIDPTYEIKLENTHFFDIDQTNKDKISTIKKEIEVWKQYSNDREVLKLYQSWEEMDRFNLVVMEGLAEYYLKRNMPQTALTYYDDLLPFVDEDKKLEIEKIIKSLEQ